MQAKDSRYADDHSTFYASSLLSHFPYSGLHFFFSFQKSPPLPLRRGDLVCGPHSNLCKDDSRLPKLSKCSSIADHFYLGAPDVAATLGLPLSLDPPFQGVRANFVVLLLVLLCFFFSFLFTQRQWQQSKPGMLLLLPI